MTTNATILNNKIAVTYSHRPDVGREYLLITVKDWDEVKKLTTKVLSYDGREFVYTSWNSDRNECFFSRGLYNPPVWDELSYDGREFVYTGWNSDRNECFFSRGLYNPPNHGIATIC